MLQGKLIGSFRFSRRGEYIGGRATSGSGPGGLTPLVARARAWPCHPRVWPGPGPPPVSALDSDSCSGKIGGSAFVSPNSVNISYVAFLKHKNSRKQGTGTLASC
jgi:hypothetical protein